MRERAARSMAGGRMPNSQDRHIFDLRSCATESIVYIPLPPPKTEDTSPVLAGEAFSFLVLRWFFAARIVAPVFLLRFLLVCLTGLAFSGCALLYSIPHHERYHRVRVTDIEGHVVAEWIAEGFVWKTELG